MGKNADKTERDGRKSAIFETTTSIQRVDGRAESSAAFTVRRNPPNDVSLVCFSCHNTVRIVTLSFDLKWTFSANDALIGTFFMETNLQYSAKILNSIVI